MLYEDKDGRILHPDDINDLEAWQIEDMGIHVHDKAQV